MPWAKKSLTIKTKMLDADVLGATVSGYLTLASSALMRERLIAEMEAHHAKSVVLDLRKAVHVLSDDDWQSLIDTRDLDFPMPVPVALVTTDVDLPKLQHLMKAMSDFGHLRGAFREPGRALEWARNWAGSWAETRP
jgi:hypothetical protein